MRPSCPRLIKTGADSWDARYPCRDAGRVEFAVDATAEVLLIDPTIAIVVVSIAGVRCASGLDAFCYGRAGGNRTARPPPVIATHRDRAACTFTDPNDTSIDQIKGLINIPVAIIVTPVAKLDDRSAYDSIALHLAV